MVVRRAYRSARKFVFADVPNVSQRLTFSGVVGERSKPTVENEREVESKLNRRGIWASDALPAMSPDPPEVANATRISIYIYICV